MTIKRILAYRMNMALTRPYTIAFETTSAVENVFLEIELSDGTLGIGAASPSMHVLHESMEDIITNLQSPKLQQWIGKDIRQFMALIGAARELFPNHPATRAAIDIALHDAFGKYLGIPIVEFYGRQHETLPTSVTIGIMDIESTLSEAAGYKTLGFSVLKIKTGLQVEEDIERCFKLRERFGSYFTIRADANQGYTAAETRKFIEATRPLGLELVEQPLPAGEEAELSALPAEMRAIIACDESLMNAVSALELSHPPAACSIFNIKLMKCGGILGAFEIANIAKSANIALFWGCFDESIASIAAALHAAFACKHTRYLDLDGSLDLAEDLVKGGFLLNKGQMRTAEGPGFGYTKL